MSVSKDDYRRTIGMFATGVTVITTAMGDHLKGMTANAVTSVSLDPTLLLVCVDKAAHTHPILKEAGAFAVNILASDQEELSRLFASKESHLSTDLFGLPHKRGALGSPIFDNVLAYVECRVAEILPGGDHDIFMGEVMDMDALRPGAEPLLFYRGKYGLFTPAEQRSAQPKP